MNISGFVNEMFSNQIVAGLSATAVIGGLMYQLKSAPQLLMRLALHVFTVELRVQNNDPAFAWVETWMSNLPYARNTRRVRLTSIEMPGASSGDLEEWVLSPGFGTHWFWWKGRLVFVERNMPDNSLGAQGGAKQSEFFKFRTIGRSQEILRDLVQEARGAVSDQRIVHIRVWRGWWRTVRGKAPRSLDTIVLQAGQAERILADMQWYLRSKEWYEMRGLPYRRGYLFDGPPGTGKTSIILALAGTLRLPVCIITLGSLQNDDALLEAIADAPPNAIIAIEDVDCASASATRVRKQETPDPLGPEKAADEASGVSKAGLLNALDGIATPDGRIFIMTTNHPERLDPALIRPGRADVRETFGLLGPAEQCRLASRFYGPGQFAALPAALSPAVMQGAFMREPNNPEAARHLLMMELGLIKFSSSVESIEEENFRKVA